MTTFSIAPIARLFLGDPNPTLSNKTQWRYGRRGSLAVDLKKNTWFDHEAREGGGVLDFICRELGCCSHQDALAWLREERLADRACFKPETGYGDLNVKPEFADRRPFPLKFWNTSTDADRSDVETYLRGRRITGPIPPSLRFHANLKHYDTGLYFPAMVAGIQADNGKVIAIQRTFLQSGGRGKAQVSRQKMTLGSLKDGAVRLAPAERSLALAEGVETALSAMQLFQIPVWAVLSCGRFITVAIPDHVIEVQIFADNGDAGRDAARKAAEHWTALGKRVVVRRPPDIFGDWNDVLPHWHERPAGEWEYV